MNRRIWIVCAVLVALGWPVAALAADPTPLSTTTPWDSISDFVAWAIGSGVLASIATAVFVKWHARPIFKVVAYLAICCVAAAINAYTKRELDLHDWSRALILTVMSGWGFYRLSKTAMDELSLITTPGTTTPPPPATP